MRWWSSMLTACALACLVAPAARASCVPAVGVDGSVLSSVHGSDRALPAGGGRVRAVAPACNDAGQRRPDGRTTVVRFAGVPADVAVRSLDGDGVYLATGSLTA